MGIIITVVTVEDKDMAERSYDELTERLHALVDPPLITTDIIGHFRSESREYSMFEMAMGTPGSGKMRVMLNAGIHGDEPATVEAIIRFIEMNRDNQELLSRFYFNIFPCNNPTGYELNTRENWAGVDLNREFAARRPAPEAKIIMDALEGRCFGLVFEMHEDIDAPGFYLYEICDNPEEHVGEKIVEVVREAGYPVDLRDEIEGMPAEGGIIRRSVKIEKFRKTRVPQAIYIYRVCGGHVLTLEPPVAVLPLEDRVKITLMALGVVLDSKTDNRKLTAISLYNCEHAKDREKG